MDKELTTESNTALAYQAHMESSQQQRQSQPDKRITDLLKEVDKRIADGADHDYYGFPKGGGGPPDPGGPSDPSGPPGPPPGPPGLPSVHASQRDSVADDVSTAAYTAEEPPRISRREADKVYISPWPKQQNLGVWRSDLIKAVCLAANDGDRAAWEEW